MFIFVREFSANSDIFIFMAARARADEKWNGNEKRESAHAPTRTERESTTQHNATLHRTLTWASIQGKKYIGVLRYL